MRYFYFHTKRNSPTFPSPLWGVLKIHCSPGLYSYFSCQTREVRIAFAYSCSIFSRETYYVLCNHCLWSMSKCYNSPKLKAISALKTFCENKFSVLHTWIVFSFLKLLLLIQELIKHSHKICSSNIGSISLHCINQIDSIIIVRLIEMLRARYSFI